LDEIAGNICEAKIKTSDLEALIEFCVKLASLYKEFPAHLIQEFRKTMPTRKGNKIENPSKLRVDLRLINFIF
jgi:regulator of nonsense transcripts 2